MNKDKHALTQAQIDTLPARHRALLEAKDANDAISLEQSYTNDPVERIIGDALTAAGFAFEYESHPNRRDEIKNGGPTLDFKIVDGPYIEVKRMATPRSEKQLASAPDVILIQGINAAIWFARALNAKIKQKDQA